jgi:hypothetical protein
MKKISYLNILFVTTLSLFTYGDANLFAQKDASEVADGMGGSGNKQGGWGSGIRIQFGTPRTHQPNYVQPHRHSHDHYQRWNYPRVQTDYPQYNRPEYVTHPAPDLARENADLKRQIEELKRQNAERDLETQNLKSDMEKLHKNFNQLIKEMSRPPAPVKELDGGRRPIQG